MQCRVYGSTNALKEGGCWRDSCACSWFASGPRARASAKRPSNQTPFRFISVHQFEMRPHKKKNTNVPICNNIISASSRTSVRPWGPMVDTATVHGAPEASSQMVAEPMRSKGRARLGWPEQENRDRTPSKTFHPQVQPKHGESRPS